MYTVKPEQHVPGRRFCAYNRVSKDESGAVENLKLTVKVRGRRR